MSMQHQNMMSSSDIFPFDISTMDKRGLTNVAAAFLPSVVSKINRVNSEIATTQYQLAQKAIGAAFSAASMVLLSGLIEGGAALIGAGISLYALKGAAGNLKKLGGLAKEETNPEASVTGGKADEDAKKASDSSSLGENNRVEEDMEETLDLNNDDIQSQMQQVTEEDRVNTERSKAEERGHGDRIAKTNGQRKAVESSTEANNRKKALEREEIGKRIDHQNQKAMFGNSVSHFSKVFTALTDSNKMQYDQANQTATNGERNLAKVRDTGDQTAAKMASVQLYTGPQQIARA